MKNTYAIVAALGCLFVLGCDEGDEEGNSCTYAHDGTCDEPNLCAAGTDASDCGYTPSADGGDQCFQMANPSDSGGSAEVCTQAACSSFSSAATAGTCPTSSVALCCALGGSDVGTTIRYYDDCDTSVCDANQAVANWTSVCNSYSGTLYDGDCGGTVISGGSSDDSSSDSSDGSSSTGGGSSTSGGACVELVSTNVYSCYYLLDSSECSGDWWSGEDCSTAQANY